MKRKGILLIFIIIPLIVNISAAGLSSSVIGENGTTIVGVDPPSILDKTLQAGSTFTVNLTVTDVANLGSWQANMSWDPSVLNWTNGWKGDFLQGNPSEEWYGRAYDDETDPFNQVTRSPTAYDPAMGNWTLPMGALSDGGMEASCATDGVTETYYNYNIPAFSGVSRVEVGLDTRTTETNSTQQDKIELQVSNDGGTTWGPVHTINVYVSPILWWEDVTSDFAWTPSMLSNANFRVRVRYKQIGAVASTIYLDWLQVRVTDTLNVENPIRAHDDNLASYAHFSYSGRTGSYSVTDFGHFLPGGGDPIEELSQILQVDFHMKYGANASSLSDQYRIVYSAPVVTYDTVILEPWSSSSTPLGTYSWLNQSDPNDDPLEPSTWGWEWDSVAAIKLTVETNNVGGDPNAMFYEYEAWVTVTYLRPTETAYSLDQDDGWVLFTELTTGSYEGVSGSGLLATFNFTVIGYGSTLLNITQTLTKLWDSDFPPETITFTPENGYFSNKITSDIRGPENPPGSGLYPPDGVVDMWDFGFMGLAYGKTSADPDWNDYKIADTRGPENPPGSGLFPPDGIVDMYDFGYCGLQYGETI